MSFLVRSGAIDAPGLMPSRRGAARAGRSRSEFSDYLDAFAQGAEGAGPAPEPRAESEAPRSDPQEETREAEPASPIESAVVAAQVAVAGDTSTNSIVTGSPSGESVANVDKDGAAPAPAPSPVSTNTLNAPTLPSQVKVDDAAVPVLEAARSALGSDQAAIEPKSVAESRALPASDAVARPADHERAVPTGRPLEAAGHPMSRPDTRETTTGNQASQEKATVEFDTDEPNTESGTKQPGEDTAGKSARARRIEEAMARALGHRANATPTNPLGEGRVANQNDSPNSGPVAGIANPSTSAQRIRVSGGSGDGPAAAVARFLIEDSGGGPTRDALGTSERKDSSASRSDPARPDTSDATLAGSVSGPGKATPSGHVRGATATFGDILASRMDPAVELDRSARVLSGSTGPGRWNVSLRLDPPDLGEMRVQVRLQQSAMTLRIETESAAVGQLVESRLRELRDSLAVHGLRVDRTEIVVRSPEANAGFAEHSRQEAGEQEQHRGSDAQERPHENWADQANFDNANEEVASGEESAVGARQGEDLEVSGRIGSEVDGLWTSTSLNLVA